MLSVRRQKEWRGECCLVVDAQWRLTAGKAVRGGAAGEGGQEGEGLIARV